MDVSVPTLTVGSILSILLSGITGLLGANQLAAARAQLQRDTNDQLEATKSESAKRLAELNSENAKRLAELNSENAKRLAELNSNLAKAATSFNWVYERKAQAAFELYPFLVRLETACRDQQRILAHGKNADLQRAMDGQDRLSKALVEFQDFYRAAALNFDDQILELIEKIDRSLSPPTIWNRLTTPALVDEIGNLRKALRDFVGALPEPPVLATRS